MMNETIVVATRLPQEDAELLKRVCDARGENMSNFLRRALKTELARLSYYPPEVKKALGIQTQVEKAEVAVS